jgi:release factor glutamine methyltransferase
MSGDGGRDAASAQPTVRQALSEAAVPLVPVAPPGQAHTEAGALLAACLGVPRSWAFAHPEATVSPTDLARFRSLVARRAAGEPLEYVLGRGDFFGLSLRLTPAVLVPRPETETLVEAALHSLAGNPRPLVADVGTGSGAIALAIAAHHPEARVIAGDVSLAALRVAAGNVRDLGLGERVHLLCANLLQPLRARFDLVAANLPYVATADLAGASAAVVRYEPRLALDGGPDGLALVRDLLRQAGEALAPGGTLLAEIGSMQGDEAAAAAASLFGARHVAVLADAFGQDRVLRVTNER